MTPIIPSCVDNPVVRNKRVGGTIKNYFSVALTPSVYCGVTIFTINSKTGYLSFSVWSRSVFFIFLRLGGILTLGLYIDKVLHLRNIFFERRSETEQFSFLLITNNGVICDICCLLLSFLNRHKIQNFHNGLINYLHKYGAKVGTREFEKFMKKSQKRSKLLTKILYWSIFQGVGTMIIMVLFGSTLSVSHIRQHWMHVLLATVGLMFWATAVFFSFFRRIWISSLLNSLISACSIIPDGTGEIMGFTEAMEQVDHLINKFGDALGPALAVDVLTMMVNTTILLFFSITNFKANTFSTFFSTVEGTVLGGLVILGICDAAQSITSQVTRKWRTALQKIGQARFYSQSRVIMSFSGVVAGAGQLEPGFLFHLNRNTFTNVT